MTDNTLDILATCALPYANGSLHFGHLLGYINADIWVRAQREQGKRVVFVCADDTHGTPIALAADQAGLSPEDYIGDIGREHEHDFLSFGILFDHYGSTNSEENKKLAQEFFLRAKDKGYIKEKTIEQLFDQDKNLFLPDRYVKGICPKCHKLDQYGDNCEGCGATYDARDLLDPRSVLSGTTPVIKESTHVFLSTKRGEESIDRFLSTEALTPSIKAKISDWTRDLRDWDISRDNPYFGFSVPGYDHLSFYVWFDAPIGYISSFSEHCQKEGVSWRNVLAKESKTSLHHFIGKDIINFHSVFWPVLLGSQDLKLPEKLHVNGYVTAQGDKYSKSRGKPILAKSYVDAGFPVDFLRYYYASRQNGSIDDLEFSTNDFVLKTNADLVGKFANLASRSAKILSTHFDNTLSAKSHDIDGLINLQKDISLARDLFDKGNTAEVVRIFVKKCDDANKLFDEEKPWVLVKDGHKERAHAVLTDTIYSLRVLGGYLSSICPNLVSDLENFLGKKCTFSDILLDSQNAWTRVNTYTPLATRLCLDDIERIVPKPPDAPKAPGP